MNLKVKALVNKHKAFLQIRPTTPVILYYDIVFTEWLHWNTVTIKTVAINPVCGVDHPPPPRFHKIYIDLRKYLSQHQQYRPTISWSARHLAGKQCIPVLQASLRADPSGGSKTKPLY